MPAKKGSIDGYNLKQKVLDGTRYIGKTVVLPMVVGAVLLSSIVYVTFGISTNAWTPSQIKQYNERERIEQQIESEHKSEVNFEYGRIFQNAKTSEDTLKIYKKYNLPFKFVEPTLEQKEKAIKQKQLEKILISK